MIANILPYKEHYDVNHFGAISLTVSDIIQVSKYSAQTYVLGGKKTDNPLTPNYQYIEYKKRLLQSRSHAYLKACVAFINSKKVSLIEVHNRPAWVPYLASHTDIPVALFLHNDPQEMKNAKTSKQRMKLLEKCAVVYCVSKFVRKRFLQGITDEKLIKKVRVIYNITYPIINVDISKKQKLILFVGRLTKEKGVIELMEALLEILPDFKDWKALIIGAPSNISFFDRSAKIVQEAVKKMPDQIIHYAKCPYKETLSWFKEAAISVVPSKWDEPFGRTVLESLTNSCALITSDKGGIPEITKDASINLTEVKSEFIAYSLRDLMNNPERLLKYQQKSQNRATEFIDDYSSVKKLDRIRKTIFR
jgi:glycosyltransferase involved in cell wall biosynthesis